MPTKEIGEELRFCPGLPAARGLLMPWCMDRELLGSIVLGAAFLPYAVEVFVQLRLQARLLAALPEPVRASLPAHPRRPWLACVGSMRFFLALWGCFRADAAGDSPRVRTLKRHMRASLNRELVWAVGSAGVLLGLLCQGWRPLWP